MELKLFDSWSAILPRAARVSVDTCMVMHWRGAFVRAVYSSISVKAHMSNGAIGSDSGSELLMESSLYHINGNGASTMNSTIYSRNIKVLDGYDDEYGGFVVDLNLHKFPAKPNAFASILHSSLLHWRMQGKKGVWLKLPLELSEFVPIAVKEGFEYHHAERGYVMLTYWLPKGPCRLPSNASHQVGVGAFVVSDKNEVLVVQEQYCPRECAGLWKLPTGFILESEDIPEGTVREVKEETGIDTEFIEVIAFRHAHGVAFDKSDLLFICMLRPISTQIMVDDHEIQAAKWMPLVDFVEQQLTQGDELFEKIIDICIDRMKKRYCGLSAHQVVSKFDGKESTLYYNVLDPQDPNSEAKLS